MNPKLIQLVELYFTQIGEVVKFNKVVSSQLVSFYSDCPNTQKAFQEIDGINDNLLDILKDTDSIGFLPVITILKLLLVRDINRNLLEFYHKVPLIDPTPLMGPIFQKMVHNSDLMISYVDDLIRTYLVNLPENMRDEYLEAIDSNTISQLLDSFSTTIDLNPNDTEAKKMIVRLELLEETHKKSSDEHYTGQR